MFYVVYLTTYRGNKLPSFYIGYTSETKIKKGYNGSVRSKRYMSIWKQERKEHPELFKTVILQRFDTDLKAREREEYLQRFFDVPNNPMYINMAIGRGRFGGCGENNPIYGTHRIHTEIAIQRMKAAHKGKTLSEAHKRAISKSSPRKKHTPEEILKMRLANLGKPKSEEFRKNMMGHPVSDITKRRQRERALSRAILTCPHCGKTMNASAAKHYHFDKCKSYRQRWTIPNPASFSI